MWKKFLSLIMVVALVCGMAVPAFAANDTQVVTLNVDGQDVTYYITDDTYRNIVRTTSNGTDYTIIYDKVSGVLSINGKIVNLEESSVVPFAWVEYERTNGQIGVDVRDVSVIAGAIIAVAGGPVSWASAVAIGGVVVARCLDTIYYTKISYYDDTLVGSRPKTKVEWHFYADANRTDEL